MDWLNNIFNYIIKQFFQINEVFFCYIYDYLKNNSLEILNIIIQFVIAVVAVGGHWFHRKLYHPDMRLNFKVKPPYCNLTNVVFPNDCQILTWSFKFRLLNEGNKDAENVQVYLVRLYMYDEKKDEEYICNSVLPMNLMWAYQDIKGEPSPIAKVISPKSEKYCDFIFVNQVHCYLITEANGAVGDITNKNIPFGRYRAYFDITMSNFKSVSYRVDFTYNGWCYKAENVITVNDVKYVNYKKCKFRQD